jgi:hypothetical protein
MSLGFRSRKCVRVTPSMARLNGTGKTQLNLGDRK